MNTAAVGGNPPPSYFIRRQPVAAGNGIPLQNLAHLGALYLGQPGNPTQVPQAQSNQAQWNNRGSVFHGQNSGRPGF